MCVEDRPFLLLSVVAMSRQSEKMWVHVTPKLQAEIERAAAEQGRSLSGLIRVVLSDWAASRGNGTASRYGAAQC
jgi:hypothetical protein